MELLIVGTVAFDTVETPYGKAERALGGSATYAALAASRFSKPGIVAVVGDDFPDTHIRRLQDRGVDTAGLTRAPGKTFFWAGRYEQDINQRTTLATELNVFENFRPEIPPAFRNASFVFLANMDPEIQLDVLRQLPNVRFSVADTMNYWIESRPEALDKVLRSVDAMLLNDAEAKQLCGTNNLVEAARKILDRGLKLVIVKKGEHGALLFGPDGWFAAPAFPLESVKDPTGAGDSFAGGFMGYLTRDASLTPGAFHRAAVAGSVVASFCVEDFSVDRLESIGADDLSRRLREFHAMTTFEPIPDEHLRPSAG